MSFAFVAALVFFPLRACKDIRLEVRQVRDYYRVQFRSGLFHIFKPPQFAFPHFRIGNPAAGVICFNRWNSAGHLVQSAADFLTL